MSKKYKKFDKRKSLTDITFTNVVFPEYCKPTKVNSISSFQNMLFSQSRILLNKANILKCIYFSLLAPQYYETKSKQIRPRQDEQNSNDVAFLRSLFHAWLRTASLTMDERNCFCPLLSLLFTNKPAEVVGKILEFWGLFTNLNLS